METFNPMIYRLSPDLKEVVQQSTMKETDNNGRSYDNTQQIAQPLPRFPARGFTDKWLGVDIPESKINFVKAETFDHHEKYGYGCAMCCNGDRCDEDCKAPYKGRRKDCPYCLGKGWFDEIPIVAFPVAVAIPATEETSITTLLNLLAQHGGAIESTASLNTMNINQARASGRMWVDENGLGFVWMPKAEFPETPEAVEQFEKWFPLEIELPESLKNFNPIAGASSQNEIERLTKLIKEAHSEGYEDAHHHIEYTKSWNEFKTDNNLNSNK